MCRVRIRWPELGPTWIEALVRDAKDLGAVRHRQMQGVFRSTRMVFWEIQVQVLLRLVCWQLVYVLHTYSAFFVVSVVFSVSSLCLST